MEDQYYEEECSSLAAGFGFSDDDEFNAYCDEMEAGAISDMNDN